MSKYIYRREQGDDNETDLKEGREIEMSTTVLHSRCSLLRLNTYISFLTATAMTPTHSMARPLKFF